MTMDRIDVAVIGAGVIGLAIARALALAGREVIVLERETAIGTGISSRNSEVIHAGMYYPANSLKARLCVEGNKRLRAYADEHHIPYRMTGKLIVAADTDEELALNAILEKGRLNGVTGLRAISASEAGQLEPNLRCRAALYSEQTGIIDSHAFMLSLRGQAEAHGAAVAFDAPVLGGSRAPDGVRLRIGGAEPMEIVANAVIIASGLAACATARSLGLSNVPREFLCKGSYFTLSGKSPFSRLVYPVPSQAGLGVHFTLDMAGQGRFGPDVEWIEQEDYRVDAGRADAFYESVRRYWPDLPNGALAAGYAGIRPKICGPDAPAADFQIAGPQQNGVEGVIALYGIESPGLTSSLALAEMIRHRLMPAD